MELNKKALTILSAAHLVTDINQGALPALLPFSKKPSTFLTQRRVSFSYSAT